MSEPTAAERVAAGAVFLDEKDPGWWREDIEHAINLGALDLRKGCGCVLGQREGTGSPLAFIARKRRLRLSTEGAIACGFLSDAVTLAEEAAEYAGLAPEWRRVITERRSAVKA